MAMTFSSQGCRQAASDLSKSAGVLDTILNTDLNAIIGRVKSAYDSETARELYAAYDKMKAKFPDFINAIKECSDYLTNTVAPAYEKVEATASSKIG